MKYKKNLLSYTSSIIKIVICMFAIAWMLPIDNISKEFAVAILIAVYLLFLFCGYKIKEIQFTYLNRKLKALSCMNVKEIECQNYTYTNVIKIINDVCNNKGDIFFIIKRENTIFRTGIRSVHGRREFGYQYYYISTIQNNKVARSEFKNFDQFVQALNQINGYRETFDVVSIDKIVVPKKKKKS